ncbi:MAG: trehalose-phosphatase [Luteimonas sp.]
MTKPAPPPIAMNDALFLDIDGCLLDFAAKPNEVCVSESLKGLLAHWLKALDGAVALISGRELADIDALFQPLSLPAVGLHGLQPRASVAPTHASFRALQHAYTSARDYADSHPGALIERKGAAMALHWRAAPHTEHALRQIAQEALQALAGYRLQEGNCVVELLPIGPDKGDALAALMAGQPFRGRRPIFAGDDVSDEPAMKMASALGGYGVGVGPRITRTARYALKDPQAVALWLAPPISLAAQSNLIAAANAT